MSGTDWTKTTNYGFYKPIPNADNDVWGDHWNANADSLDALIKTVQNASGVTTWNTRSGAVSLNQADVTTVLPPSAATPVMDGTASAGTNMTWSKSDHVHPTDTTRYAASNPAGYVTAGGAATAAPVQSVATRTGAVVLTHTDITDWTPTLAPYAPLASPALTGSPTAPTVSPTTDSSTKLATTAFVQSALAAGGVVSFNTRTGVVTLSSADITAAGGALLASPVFTGDPQAPQPAAGDADASIATTAFVAGSVASAHRNVGRNLIHNPLFNVAQRGAGPWTTTGYTGDRWIAITADTISIAQSALADADRTAIGDETARFALSNVFTGTAGAGAFTMLAHRIETLRRLANQTVIVSFWARAAASAPKLGVSLDQYFGTGGSPSVGVNGNGSAVTLSTTWARYTLTFAIPSSSGKTLGTNNDDYTQFNIWYSSGATNNVRAGSIGVQSGTIQLWGVQLEIGSVATPLEKPDPRYDLANCQRFYQTGMVSVWGYGAAASGAGGGFPLPVTMRAAPTVAFSNQGYSNSSALGTQSTYPSGFVFTVAVTATGALIGSGNFTASADL